MATGPAGSQSGRRRFRACRQPACAGSPRPTPARPDRQCGTSAAARRRFAPGCRCCCCCSRRCTTIRSSGCSREQRDDGVLAILRGAADRVEGAEAARPAGRRRSGRASPARNISPISSDSELSIVVWLAQPTRCEMRVGVEAGRDGVLERAAGSASRLAAVADVVADRPGLGAVQDDEVVRRRRRAAPATRWPASPRASTCRG